MAWRREEGTPDREAEGWIERMENGGVEGGEKERERNIVPPLV